MGKGRTSLFIPEKLSEWGFLGVGGGGGGVQEISKKDTVAVAGFPDEEHKERSNREVEPRHQNGWGTREVKLNRISLLVTPGTSKARTKVQVGKKKKIAMIGIST